eukprot:TRINITY_DN4050_c0_g1_i1.p1 TRINITY_DN4050_c0_g1~~TRINITY_DN4050_c0_g1_i1.p1  ORF type:complete len:230 (-),score=30.70 TRINITY_DN4050_c0_g1_i1:105-794(-)
MSSSGEDISLDDFQFFVERSVPTCPICSKSFHFNNEKLINQHIDECLNKPMIQQLQNHNNNNLKPKHKKEHSPFLVKCPYVGCSLEIEAMFFPAHVLANHSAGAQNYACPICALAGFEFTVKPATNLLNHIQSAHTDLVGNMAPSNFINLDDDLLLTDLDDYVPPSSEERLEGVVTTPMQGECVICFESFQKGHNYVRLQCLCVFHKGCIEDWFTRKKECPTHAKSTGE